MELDLLLTYHKQQTGSFWGTRQSPSPAKQSTRLMWKSQYVPFDGIPFINSGRENNDYVDGFLYTYLKSELVFLNVVFNLGVSKFKVGKVSPTVLTCSSVQIGVSDDLMYIANKKAVLWSSFIDTLLWIFKEGMAFFLIS